MLSFRYKKANYIQNVPNDEITCDILQAHTSCPSSNQQSFARNASRDVPPPLPPRLRSFVPHRGSKLSNLEAAMSTGIPTVQVRPLSMSERQATPPPGGLLESAANYGSAAEELERLGRGPEADGEDNVDDWKAALQFVNFNDDSLERLKAVASSLGTFTVGVVLVVVLSSGNCFLIRISCDAAEKTRRRRRSVGGSFSYKYSVPTRG